MPRNLHDSFGGEVGRSLGAASFAARCGRFRGTAAWGFPCCWMIQADCGVRFELNTWKLESDSAGPACSAWGDRREGASTATLELRMTFAFINKPPAACHHRARQNGSVSARRVAGGPKSVVSARAALLGLEATRVWAGKVNVAENTNFLRPVCRRSVHRSGSRSEYSRCVIWIPARSRAAR